VLPFEQAPNPYVTPELSFQFHYFAIRKMHLLMRAKSLVAFPGGFGTLDELFEALTLIQTTKVKPIPVLLFGRDFWKRLINFDLLVEEGTIAARDLELFKYVETAEEAWKVIAECNGID
ncbi:MAG TPA: LOG family protein, partial [Desulfomicrobiaceae bacterium]|nr:LOG family protein [Desulfomicrobiaceae bacterium]